MEFLRNKMSYSEQAVTRFTKFIEQVGSYPRFKFWKDDLSLKVLARLGGMQKQEESAIGENGIWSKDGWKNDQAAFSKN